MKNFTNDLRNPQLLLMNDGQIYIFFVTFMEIEKKWMTQEQNVYKAWNHDLKKKGHNNSQELFVLLYYRIYYELEKVTVSIDQRICN